MVVTLFVQQKGGDFLLRIVSIPAPTANNHRINELPTSQCDPASVENSEIPQIFSCLQITSIICQKVDSKFDASLFNNDTSLIY